MGVRGCNRPVAVPGQAEGVLGGAEARLIVALAHAASVEHGEDDRSDRRVCRRCGRGCPECSCRGRWARGHTDAAAGQEPEGRGCELRPQPRRANRSWRCTR